jgi:hypothetical protein
MMSAQIEDVKQIAHHLIDQLPDGVSWEKLLYTLQIRQDIEAGLEDIKAGRVMTTEELKAEFKLTED